jgi:membrane protein YdbS with pleckstrin-like domain
MSILISKDGLQLGPFSLEQARALVLGGTLDADDWAWPDGATEWIMLKDVPGFTVAKAAPPPSTPPAKAALPLVSQPAGTASSAADPAVPLAEEVLWRGHPSQILNFTIYVFWVVVLIVAAGAAAVVWPDSVFWALVIFGAVAVIALGQSLWAYFHLRMVEYVISTQRVRIISGLFSKEVQEIELFRVKDTAARQSFLQRLFGLGTITVLSGDPSHPRLVLDGVPNALEMRERLRQEVMALRQRFGVRELDVM